MRTSPPSPPCALSLFSSAGIGELGIRSTGIPILVSNELLPERCAMYHHNFPEVTSICGDIWELKSKIISEWRHKSDSSPYLIYATPPCQGMSSNGAGKILHEIRAGRRPDEDPRNRLIIPTMDIISKLRPQWVLFENVPTMSNTVIRTETNEFQNIIEYIRKRLGDEYVGTAEVVNCADYGIPQVRKRLISLFTRSPKGHRRFAKHGTLLPDRTHDETGLLLKKWITLRDAIGGLPPLAAKKGLNEDPTNPWHKVPIMKDEKYWWMENTPEGETAYNNQCVNPSCGYKNNPLHGSNYAEGFHRANQETPIYCVKCGQLLPRPSVLDKKTGKRRLIKGFDTAYRRMEWDKPAPTLTQNFLFEASDKKVHPDQTRVLSVYEGMVLQSISDYQFEFVENGSPVSINRCAEVIGESVPPKLIELICRHMLSIDAFGTD